jgi:hypothetical protein
MALLTGYLDDSGQYIREGHKGNTRLRVFGGFISTVEQWQHFEHDWNTVLQLPQFGLSYFHMKEIRQGKGEPWAKFKDNLPLQTDLLDRLQRVLKIRAHKTIAGCVDVKAWDRMNARYEMAEKYHSPTVLAGTLAIHKTLRWKDAKRQSDELAFVVDEGIDEWGALDDAVYREYGFRLLPGKPSKTPGLQAGDLLAWELHRVMSKLLEKEIDNWSQVRGSFVALLERFNGADWFVQDEDAMHESFSRIGYPPERT